MRAFLLCVALTGVVAAGVPEPLRLPDARTATPVAGPTARVNVYADGAFEYVGVALPRTAALVEPALSAPLRAFHDAVPDGTVVVAADRRVDVRNVRAALTTAMDAGIDHFTLLAASGGALPLADFATFGLLSDDGALPPVTVHLRAEDLAFGRDSDAMATVPRVAGALDLPALAALLDDDRRLYPGEDRTLLNTDDGVAYADLVAVLDLTRAKGYGRTLLAGGPAAPDAAPAGPTLVGPLPRHVIDGVMRAPANMGRISDCYGDYLGAGKTGRGTVTMTIVIGASGAVAYTAVTNTTIDDPALLTCLRATVLTYQFPPPAGGGDVKVVYPFVFAPE